MSENTFISISKADNEGTAQRRISADGIKSRVCSFSGWFVHHVSVFFVLFRLRCVHVHPGQRHRYVPPPRLQQRRSRTWTLQDEGRGGPPLLQFPRESGETGSHSGARSDVTGGMLRAAQTADSHDSVRLGDGGAGLCWRHPGR